ncbi:hypothetical protein AR457_09085 [Streptomyces agglomeratus]|uniref:Uncharacterized protein n=1 Tax=Streptomyces agglomeratus TaxID=285458 RepID=A0A1E5P541_9ACTN|nr:hypothetical protein AS594_09260 [Streptomyces agglomeratus]OEJ41390.1 hypothetical protein BGK70_27580 [Streptomyces agglomeratus]OEJ44233.1 hypothetical protein AR457_09085 [Streptomyces agglomeratus]OEJ53893.1 hypothetical protein BGK72_26935 [Streptomyces agglomeratus]OEJ61258.1 hypothetical protein BGM19_27805 [Streptomyces agglomeratus]
MQTDPEYTFAQLPHQACNEGVDPESLRRCLRQERAERKRPRPRVVRTRQATRSVRPQAAARQSAPPAKARPGAGGARGGVRRQDGQHGRSER